MSMVRARCGYDSSLSTVTSGGAPIRTGGPKTPRPASRRAIEPWLPPPVRLGRPRKTDLRAVLDAIYYLLRAGCQWRLLPRNASHLGARVASATSAAGGGRAPCLGLYYALLVLARASAGREAQPTAGIVDSQSVRTSESGGPRGYDAGKKINGRKRHILVDTLGLLLRQHRSSRQRPGPPTGWPRCSRASAAASPFSP